MDDRGGHLNMNLEFEIRRIIKWSILSTLYELPRDDVSKDENLAEVTRTIGWVLSRMAEPAESTRRKLYTEALNMVQDEYLVEFPDSLPLELHSWEEVDNQDMWGSFCPGDLVFSSTGPYSRGAIRCLGTCYPTESSVHCGMGQDAIW